MCLYFFSQKNGRKFTFRTMFQKLKIIKYFSEYYLLAKCNMGYILNWVIITWLEYMYKSQLKRLPALVLWVKSKGLTRA